VKRILEPEKSGFVEKWIQKYKIHCRPYIALLFHLLLPSCSLCQPCSSPLFP